MRLNGGGGTNDFSAEITETVGSTTTARKSIYGYLVLTGSGATSAVKVNTRNDGTGTNVATLSVSSVYTEGDTAGKATGWSNAYGKVEIPTSNTSTNAATFKAPNATATSNPAQNTYSLSMGNQGDNAMNLLMSVNGATAITIARFTHNKYTAGETAGWSAAYGKVVVPTSNTSTNAATFKAPASSSTSNPAQNTYSLVMGNQGDNATNLQMSVNGATAITIARFTHNKYSSGETAGWTAAYGKVSIPTSNTSTNAATFKAPASASTSNPVQNTYSLSMGNQGDNAMNLQMSVNGATAITIARFTHNKYSSGETAGWTAAYGKVAVPTSNTSTNAATFKTPNDASTSNPAQNSHALSMSNQGDNAVNLQMATNSGTAITIARFTHNKYSAGETAGWTAAYGKVAVPTSNTSSNSATFKTPNSASTSNPAQNTHSLSIGNQGDNAVNLLMATNNGTAITIARFTHNKYSAGETAGWTAAYGKVSVPGSNTSSSTATFKTPASSSTSNPVQNTHSLSIGNQGDNAVNLYMATNSGTAITIARFTHNKFTAGQKDTRDSVSTVPVTLSGGIVYDSGTGKYMQSGTATVTFSNGQTDVTGVDCWGGVDVTAAHTAGQSAGWSSAYGKVSIPGSNTSSNSATFKTPNSASNSNPVQNSHALSMGNQGNNAVDLYMATNSGTAITIARFTHNKYSAGETAGWTAAYGKVSVPGSNTSSNSATFKTPASSSGSNPVQNSHALSMGNQGDNAVDLYMATNSGTAITVARFTHNKYTAGQENCRSSISQVPVVLSGNVVRDSSTGKYMQHGEATVKFSNGQTQVTGIDCYGGVDVTAAFSAGVASVSGDYSTGFTDGQNNSRNSITNVVVSLTGQVSYNSQNGKYYQSGTATVNFSNGQSAKTGLDCYGGVDVSDARANGYAVSTGQISITGLQNASGSSSISGRTSAGGISRPSSQSYIFFSVSVHGTTKNYYISVN